VSVATANESVPGPFAWQDRHLSRFAVIAAVARRSGPHLIEATVVPAVLFYASFAVIGLGAAYIAALVWSYSALTRRLLTDAPVPPILVLGVIGVTLKTVVAVLSHSAFLYFFQPVLATLAMGFVFLLSVAVGRPLIARLAGEFWPISSEMAANPGITRLFRDLTLLWAACNFLSAFVTLVMLVYLPLGAFVPLKQLSGYAMTATTVFLTVSLSLSAARREGLIPLSADRSLA
jgi:hypothetical protein